MVNHEEPNLIRLMKSMEKHGQKEAGETFSKENPIEVSADIKSKFEWAKKACAYLE